MRQPREPIHSMYYNTPMIKRIIIRYKLVVGLVVALFAVGSAYGVDEEVWFLVDTKARILSVKQGSETKVVFENIAIGRRGTASDKVRGDDKTPLGIYRIGWVNTKSRFHRFYGVNYPSRVDAQRGLQQGMIDSVTYRDLLHADLMNGVPRQDTPLGGQIGIHGVGGGDPFIHSSSDWTHGCIALTDKQIDQFGAWVKKGAVVIIK